MKQLLYLIVGIALLSLSVFFASVTAYVFSTEVWPAISNGSFEVETSTMILNRLWEGNEIYVLLGAYSVVAIGFAYGAIRVVMKAVGHR